MQIKLTREIKNLKNIRVFGLISLVALVILTISTVVPIYIESKNVEGTAGVVEVPTLTMVVGKESANLDLVVNSSNGTFASTDSDNMAAFTVQTNNYTGYTLMVSASDNKQELNNTSTGETLKSITSAVDSDTFSKPDDTTLNKWGYQPSKLNSSINTDFLPAPTTTATVLDKTDGANTTANSYTIGLGAKVDYTKPSGTYTNTYILTATANPVAYHIYYYDGVNEASIGEQQSETNTAATIKISPTYTSGKAPTRSTYTFKSWCLGTVNSTTVYNSSNKTYSNPATICTGTEYKTGANLKIDSTVDNSNIKLYAVWTPTTFADAYGTTEMTMQNMSSTICSKVTPNQYANLTDIRDNQSYVAAKLEDNRCWMADNLRLDVYAVTLDNLYSNTNANNSTLRYLKNGGGSSPYATDAVVRDTNGTTFLASYTAPSISTVYKNTKAGVTYGIGSGKIGVYYNYCAASAGSFCYTSSTGEGDTKYDICPRNWRLPTGGPSGEFKELYSAYDNDVATTRKMLSTPLSGGIESPGVEGDGEKGRFWSSSIYDTSIMYTLYVTNQAFSVTGSHHRNNGRSIRCIAR